nr:transposase [Marinagarivorans cellulosilyticus]
MSNSFYVIEDRLLLLAEVFAIDLCAYAVMSNHVHTVLHINAAEAHDLTDLEVCERWHRLYKGTVLTQKYARQDPMNKAEQVAVKMRIDQWRLNLFDISKFMKALNEPIARMANAEDKCTGRFWEGRFKSQALCDEAALAACMAYVDLNPIRAKMAETPEASDHTSIKQRIAAAKNNETPKNLAQFVGNPREPMPHGLPFTLKDYIELVDWTGRAIRNDKRGYIASTLPPIIDRLGIEPENWLELTGAFEKNTKTFVGTGDHIESAALAMGYQRTPNRRRCQSLFG